MNQIDANSPPCGYELPTPAFKTGRTDCVPSCVGKYADTPFCTQDHEVHPSPNANGKDTADFFTENFGLTPRETIALMGAHTLGHPMEFNSMMRHYPWTRRFNNLDNRYFINIAHSRNYKYQNPIQLPIFKENKIRPTTCNFPVSAFMGDEYGAANRYAYRAKSERKTSAWGPWTWALFSHGCSKDICAGIKATGDYAINSCCHYLDACKGNACKQKKFDCSDQTGGAACPKTFFQSISMISPDIGLHKKFDINEDGRPVNCPGLDNERWLDNKNVQSGFVQCERNDMPAHSNNMSMAEVVEMYAADNNAWIQDFVPVFNKMLENGVDQDDLKATPSYHWFQ